MSTERFEALVKEITKALTNCDNDATMNIAACMYFVEVSIEAISKNKAEIDRITPADELLLYNIGLNLAGSRMAEVGKQLADLSGLEQIGDPLAKFESLPVDMSDEMYANKMLEMFGPIKKDLH